MEGSARQQGIEAARQKEKAFFQLAERFRAASDPEQVKTTRQRVGPLRLRRMMLGNPRLRDV
jgi:hypothetical protein